MSMTTSIQLAQECLKQGPSAGEEQAESSQTFEGLEAFAQTIESGKLFQNNIIIYLQYVCLIDCQSQSWFQKFNRSGL